MKWALFIASVLLAYAGGRALRAHRKPQLALWTLVGFLPFCQQLGMGMVFDRDFPGDAHGLEVALVDILVVTLFAAAKPPLTQTPYKLLLGAYLISCVVSIAQAAYPLASLFYVWKLLRMLLLFGVLAYAARTDPLVAPAVLRGMMLGTLYQFGLVLWQRYGLGVHQVTGSFDHQNALGVALNLVLMVPFALALARRFTWLTLLVPLTGLVTIVLTLSRGAILFFGVGLAAVLALSLLRGRRTLKMVVASVGALIAALVFAKAGERIVERFETAPPESMETRKRFEAAASMMLSDRPMGVGVNHFAWNMSERHYGARAGIYGGDQRAIVHNLYWLTAAEMGYVGLLALLAMLIVPIASALRWALKVREDIRGDALLGIGVGLLLCGAHGTLEWIWRSTEVSYVFWSLLALSTGLVAQLKSSRVSSTRD